MQICRHLKMMPGITFKLQDSWPPFQINDSEIKGAVSWGKHRQGRWWSPMAALVTDTELHELSTATRLEMSFPPAERASHPSSPPHFYSPTNWWIHASSSRQWHSSCKARLLMSYKRRFVTPSNYGWQHGLLSAVTTAAIAGASGMNAKAQAPLRQGHSAHFPQETGSSRGLKLLWPRGKNSHRGKKHTKFKKKINIYI